MKNLVSVIVSVYNGEKYIVKCIKSIQAQTYENLEIIIIDDGSTDNSLEYCKELASQDERINFIHTENCGVACARNVGLEVAKGEYITFVDADDYIKTNRIDNLVSLISLYDADIVYTDFLYLSNVIEENSCDESHVVRGGGVFR